MPKHVLCVDAGGTKTLIRVYNDTDQMLGEQRFEGASLGHQLDDSCQRIYQYIESVLAQYLLDAQQCLCVIGVAGAGNAHNKKALTQCLSALSFSALQIESDALTSAFGANAGQNVACVALGTGSVGTRLEQGKATLVGGWGFTVGDEGSGAKLGLLAIQALINAIDKGVDFCPLLTALGALVGNDRAQLASWIKQAQVSDYAAISPIVWEHEHTDAGQKILAQHVHSVEQLIDLTRANQALPVVLLGGLAQRTAALLSPEYRSLIQAAKGNSVDGAFLLAQKLRTDGNLK